MAIVIDGFLFHTVYKQKSLDVKSIDYICVADAAGKFEALMNDPVTEIVEWSCEAAYGYGYGNDIASDVADYLSVLAANKPTNLYDVQLMDDRNQDLLRGDGANISNTDNVYKYNSDSTKLSIYNTGTIKVLASGLGAGKIFTLRIYYK